jgi:hypothetical protein
MVEYGPMDLMGENGLYLYMVEMVIKKEKKNRVNLRDYMRIMML